MPCLYSVRHMRQKPRVIEPMRDIGFVCPIADMQSMSRVLSDTVRAVYV